MPAICARTDLSAVLLALLSLLSLLCLGCSGDARVLTAWTRVSPDPAPALVTLPGEIRSGATTDDARATLTTTVPIPPEWRRGPLTLAIPEFEGNIALYADGRRLSDLRLGFAHAWRIDEAAGIPSEVLLRLELAPAIYPRLFTAPRLSPTTDGDDWYRFVRDETYIASSAATSILAFLALLYFVLFLLDRRRPHGWFAWQAFCGLAVTSRVILDGPCIGGVRELQLDIFAGTMGLLGAAFFASAHFHTRPPPRPLFFLPLVVLPMSFVHGAAGVALAARAALVVCLCGFAWMTATLLRVQATEDRLGARTLAAGWLFFLALGSTDLGAISGLGEVAGGFRGGVLGMVTFASLQVTLLLRDYVRSIRAADAHAAVVEAQSEQVRSLNLELRRQIAERSRQLSEALARIGQVAPRRMRFEPGDVVHGRYRVVRAIGQGGMGAVYEVTRIADERHFALKVLTGATSGVALARLAREAQIAARLSHERLVAIADVDVSESGALYIVMELVLGAALADLHERFGDPAWALPILRQVATGLAALHAEGIVHRDLKPANVLLARPGDALDPGAKIADFGIARLTEGGAVEENAAIDPDADTAAPSNRPGLGTALTEVGMLLGTPIYMAPELAGGARDAKPSSDVWAFGVIAYQLMTGALPFAAPPVLEAIARRPWVSARALDEARYGAPVAALVARCLLGAPGSRPTAEECVAALS